MANDISGLLGLCFLHLLPGGSTSQESLARGDMQGQGLVTHSAWVQSHQGGVTEALSDWLPINEDRHSGRWG